MVKAAFIYDERQSRFIIRDEHPLRPSRLRYTFELLDAYGAFDRQGSRLARPELADELDLLVFHSRDYVETVKRLDRGEPAPDAAAHGFSDTGDNPPFPGMWDAAVLAVGGTLLAARMVADEEADIAFNIGGGLHHAQPDRASGFCIFNDAVIAIKRLLERGLKVAYVDIDSHHADGVQGAFYDTDRVLTISLHESGRYLFPGTGEVEEIGTGPGKGYSVNVPLFPYTDDETYIWAFREVVPPLVTRFAPDILVSQLGSDTHYLDPLTNMMLTTAGYEQAVKEIKALAGKWVALGGGGYDLWATARCWALAYGTMVGSEWDDDVPKIIQHQYGVNRLRDKEKPSLDDKKRDRMREFAADSVQRLKKLIFPMHGLSV